MESNVHVGQIVHYVLTSGECRAAMVVRAWSDDMVNLYVFLDGKNDSHNEHNLFGLGLLWATSVHYADYVADDFTRHSWHMAH